MRSQNLACRVFFLTYALIQVSFAQDAQDQGRNIGVPEEQLTEQNVIEVDKHIHHPVKINRKVNIIDRHFFTKVYEHQVINHKPDFQKPKFQIFHNGKLVDDPKALNISMTEIMNNCDDAEGGCDKNNDDPPTKPPGSGKRVKGRPADRTRDDKKRGGRAKEKSGSGLQRKNGIASQSEIEAAWKQIPLLKTRPRKTKQKPSNKQPAAQAKRPAGKKLVTKSRQRQMTFSIDLPKPPPACIGGR